FTVVVVGEGGGEGRALRNSKRLVSPLRKRTVLWSPRDEGSIPRAVSAIVDGEVVRTSRHPPSPSVRPVTARRTGATSDSYISSALLFSVGTGPVDTNTVTDTLPPSLVGVGAPCCSHHGVVSIRYMVTNTAGKPATTTRPGVKSQISSAPAAVGVDFSDGA